MDFTFTVSWATMLITLNNTKAMIGRVGSAKSFREHPVGERVQIY